MASLQKILLSRIKIKIWRHADNLIHFYCQPLAKYLDSTYNPCRAVTNKCAKVCLKNMALITRTVIKQPRIYIFLHFSIYLFSKEEH